MHTDVIGLIDDIKFVFNQYIPGSCLLLVRISSVSHRMDLNVHANKTIQRLRHKSNIESTWLNQWRVVLEVT